MIENDPNINIKGLVIRISIIGVVSTALLYIVGLVIV
jgi:hypothetical protein